MRSVKTVFVIYNKLSKMFDGNNEDGEMTDDLFDAYIYTTHKEAENELGNFDEPKDFEIWEIEMIYKTK